MMTGKFLMADAAAATGRRDLLVLAALIGLFGAAAALAAPTQYVHKTPAGTMTYTIVLAGHLDRASPAGTPVKQRYHDVVNIHRTLEVEATMYRVPAVTAADCYRACGEHWADKAVAGLDARIRKKCGGNMVCSLRARPKLAVETGRIEVLDNLQSLAAVGPTWAATASCTATVSVDDTETLSRYVSADESPTGKALGLVTRSGSQRGNVKGAACDKVFDHAYALYLTVPRKAQGYEVQLPPFVIPVTVTTHIPGMDTDHGKAGLAYGELPDSRILLGRHDPLPLPAPGRLYAGKRHVKTLFKFDQTPVYDRDAFIPVNADISWRFTPATSPSINTASGH